MNTQNSADDEKHPAARHSDQLAWAVWIGNDIGDSNVVAVLGDSEAEARQNARDRDEFDGEIVHVDGPYQDSEPGVWKFEFVTEHRETVVVEAPNADYAADSAESERDHRGEYVATTHTESRRLDVDVPQSGAAGEADHE